MPGGVRSAELIPVASQGKGLGETLGLNLVFIEGLSLGLVNFFFKLS